MYRTSSVMMVAMERPISWYCWAFPSGPRRMKRNLICDSRWFREWNSFLDYWIHIIWFNINLLLVYLQRAVATWWVWGLQWVRWAAQQGRGGQTPQWVSPGSPVLPLVHWRPLHPLESFSWSACPPGETKSKVISEYKINDVIPIVVNCLLKEKSLHNLNANRQTEMASVGIVHAALSPRVQPEKLVCI